MLRSKICDLEPQRREEAVDNMTAFLSKVHYLSKRIKVNQICCWKQQSIHTSYALFEQPTFNEKPPWLKKLKMKQAAMQKNDGLPTYLKGGLPDKILFNITLSLVAYGMYLVYETIVELESKTK